MKYHVAFGPRVGLDDAHLRVLTDDREQPRVRHARCARHGGVEQHVHGSFDHRVLPHVDERAFLEERRVQCREGRSAEWRDPGEVRLDGGAARAKQEAERAHLEAGREVRHTRQRRNEDAVHEHQFRRRVGAEGPPREIGRRDVQRFTRHERSLRDWRDGRETPFLIARRRKALRCERSHGALALPAQPGGPLLVAGGHARLELGEEPRAGGGGGRALLEHRSHRQARPAAEATSGSSSQP